MQSLTLSEGTLNPVFSAGTASYTAVVANGTTSITVTPVTDDAAATVRVQGVLVASGSASDAIPLNINDNNITTVVTAQDGTTKTYTIVVNRPQLADVHLKSLTLSSGMLTPVFSTNIQSYTSTVANGLSSVTLTPVTIDAGATVKVNNVAVTSGTASAAISLVVGNNTITTRVSTSYQNKAATRDYTVVITRAGSANSDLASLAISSGPLSPAFVSNIIAYTTTAVANNVASVTVTPVTADATATVKINGVAVTNGVATTVPLLVGDNTINTVVTAQDGTTIKTYTIGVNRAASANTDLASLTLSIGNPPATFISNNTPYVTSVPYSVNSFTLTAVTADATSTVKVNGVLIANGVPVVIPLPVGIDGFAINVTAQNGTVKTYLVFITRRVASTNADLSSLAISSGTLTPAFANGITIYNVSVDNNVNSVTLTLSTADATATIKVNGVAVTSGSASAAIPLAVGSNTITSIVTAEDGTTRKTYSIVVNRAASANTDLVSLVLSIGNPPPGFLTNNTPYVTSVDNSVSSYILTAVTADPTATVKVNGALITNGSPVVIPLPVGIDGFAINVTAQNGTVKTYLVFITRRDPSSNNNLASLTLSTGNPPANFIDNNTPYVTSVDNSVTSFTLTAITADATATIKVNGEPIANGAPVIIPLPVGIDGFAINVTAQNGTVKTYLVFITRRAGSDNANLQALLLSSGILSPTFASGAADYTASVTNNVSSITITPSTADATATIKVNGVAVTNGAASGAIPLTVGNNTITTIVTAQDGTTTKTYTLVATRKPSSNADLASLTLSAGTLSPVFSSATTSYTASVDNSVTSLHLTPLTVDATASVKVNGLLVTTAPNYAFISLELGNNTILVVVTAQDGSTKTYTVIINRAMGTSSNANLKTVSFRGGASADITINIDSATTYYASTISTISPSTSDHLDIGVVPSDPAADYKITVPPPTGGGFGSYSLSIFGVYPEDVAVPITITVTAPNGNQKVYTVYITLESRPVYYATLTLSPAQLYPGFSYNIHNYTASIANNVTSVNLNTQFPFTVPPFSGQTVTYTVNGNPAFVSYYSSYSTAYYGPIPLNVGPNTITLNVAVNGVNNIYTFVITRAPASNQQVLALNTIKTTDVISSNIELTSLNLSSGVLSPNFISSQYKYMVSVPYNTNGINVTPTVSNADAGNVKINSWTVANGTASPNIPLSVGQNIITTVVTAKDGSAKTYTVEVNRKQPLITVVNTFTPNGDGINDTWNIKNIEQFPDCEIKVIDRYNHVLYQSIGYPRPWDGRAINGDTPTGTLYYYIDLKHGQEIYTGSVTVVK